MCKRVYIVFLSRNIVIFPGFSSVYFLIKYPSFIYFLRLREGTVCIAKGRQGRGRAVRDEVDALKHFTSHYKLVNVAVLWFFLHCYFLRSSNFSELVEIYLPRTDWNVWDAFTLGLLHNFSTDAFLWFSFNDARLCTYIFTVKYISRWEGKLAHQNRTVDRCGLLEAINIFIKFSPRWKKDVGFC